MEVDRYDVKWLGVNYVNIIQHINICRAHSTFHVAISMILMLLAPHVAILLRAALKAMSRSESRWYCAQNCSRPISESSARMCASVSV